MKRMNGEEEELILQEPYSVCERQVCATSPPNVPIRRYKYTEGRIQGEFQREDFGCWRLFVGGPQRVQDIVGVCHTTSQSNSCME